MSHFLLYIGVGALAGILSGLLGIGGGVITVPAFIWIFDYAGFDHSVIAHLAIGTSLAAMIVTTSVTTFAHARRGFSFDTILYYFTPGIVLGAMCGALVAHYIHSYLLQTSFSMLILIVSFNEFFSKESAVKKVVKGFAISLGSFVIGGVSSMLGVGGGVFTIPFLRYCGIAMRHAVAISAFSGLMIAITGTLTMLIIGINETNLPPHSTGYIYWPACLGVMIGSPLFSIMGAELSHRLSVKVLKKVFSVILIFVALKLSVLKLLFSI